MPKHPKTQATPGGVAKGPSNRKPRYPTGDAGELFKLMDDAAKAVLSDRNVWLEEAQRTGAEAVPWPLKHDQGATGEAGYAELLRHCMENAVQLIVELTAKVTKEAPIQQDHSQLEFQTVLRIAMRATEAADKAARTRFGGTGRLSIKRAHDKWMTERAVEAAIESGEKRDTAFERAGKSRSAAYRAMQRLHGKAKR